MKLSVDQEKWLSALESGKYSQVKGSLAKPLEEEGTVGYCCLGVAELLFIGEDSPRLEIMSHAISKHALPSQSVVSCLRLKSAMHLAKLNDKQQLSFAQIAAAIRLVPELYFDP